MPDCVRVAFFTPKAKFMPLQKNKRSINFLVRLAFITVLCFFPPLQSVSQAAQDLPVSPQSNHLNVQDSGKITLKDFLSGLGGVVALGTLMFGVYQYRANHQWKKTEFIVKQVKEFEDDPDVKNVMMMLDWNEPKIILSEKKEIERVTENILKICLISGDLDSQKKQLEALNGQQEFTDEQLIVRNAFSKFLDYLERFDNFIETKLISKKELKPYLMYWLKVIGNENKKRQIKSEDFYTYLWKFIDFYDYSGVQALLKRYGYNIKPKQPEKDCLF